VHLQWNKVWRVLQEDETRYTALPDSGMMNSYLKKLGEYYLIILDKFLFQIQK
jgi:hypothetical protein